MTTERWQDWVLGLTALLWGSILTLPGDLLAQVPLYAAVASAMPDWVWGTLLMVCSLAVLLPTPLRWRSQAHAGAGVLWGLVVILLISNRLCVTTIMLAAPFMALTLLHAFEYVKLSQLARL